MSLKRAIPLLFVFFLFHPLSARAFDAPFKPGEKLDFVLSWEFVPAGKATLTVAPMVEIDDELMFHFVLTVKTNSFLDLFYKVRDQIDSYVDVAMTHSTLYEKKQRESKTKRNVTVTFDWEKNQAQYNRSGKKKAPVILQPGAFDPLGIFYFVRSSNHLKPGTVIERPVSDGKRCVIGFGRVVKRETITVPAGTFDTFLIEPDLKDVKGVFEKSKDSNILIWVTADSQHIPVKIQSKVVIGRFMGELTDAHIP